MNALTWQASFLMSVLVVCVSGLVWKGAIPSHALFTIIGAIVGFLGHQAAIRMMTSSASRRAAQLSEAREADEEFSPDEIVTNNESLHPPPLPSKEAKK